MVMFMYSMSPNACRTTYPIVTSYFQTFDFILKHVLKVQSFKASKHMKGMFLAKGPIFWGLHVSASLQGNLC